MKQRNEKYTGSISIKSMGKRVLALLLVISMSMSYMAPLASAAEKVSCGREAHAHTEGCYEQKRICTMPDAHVHTDACYELQEAYACGQEETPDHTHEDSCRTAQQVLLCTLETAEDAHVHGQACYAEELICKLEEHQHTALCDTAPEREETQSTTAPEETTEPEATTAPEETTVPEDTAATENTTAPSIEALADVEPIKIWVDPTNGGNEFYKGLTVDYRELTPDEQGKVTFKLPTVDETGSPRDYKYKIRTWYDIATRVGYAPGAEVTTDKNMVFYADWEPVTYDVGRYQEGHMVEGIDTSEFVTVTMYDYNDIANLAGATLKESRATGADKEVWSANGFDTNPLTVHTWRDSKDSLEFPQDTPENSASTDAAAMFPGIINTGLFRYAAQHYFPAIDRGAAGVKKVGTANYLFQYGVDPNNLTMDKVADPNPYFYFDSHTNGAAYSRGQGRFYLYDAPSMTSCIDAANQGSAGDYLPYNLAHGDGVVVIDHDGTGKGNANYEKLEDANYWYGMLVEINFYIPEIPGTEAGRLHNKSEGIDGQKNDMIFRFLGDDDVWVLVDGQMVLDMGGIHEPVGGEINFATGEAHTYDDNGIYDATLQSLQPGNHTIQMYYMERGGGMANCGVWFNLMARQSLKINKADPQDENAEMAGTVFTVYEDAACTTPCDELFSDAKMEMPASSFTIDENGSTMLYGFLWDKDYYIKETTTPAGYEKYVPDRTIKINFGYDGTMKVDVTPQNTLPGYDGIVYTYVDDGSVGDDKHGEITVYNTKSTQDLRLRKYWYNEEGLRDTSKTDPVTVDIFRTTSKDTKLEALTAANLYKANVSIDEMVNNTLMKTLQNVEQYNTNGELYYYYAVEKTVEGYGTPVYLANGVITGGIITVANAPEGVNIEYHNPEFTLVKKNYANQTLTGAAFDLYEYVSTTGKYLKLGSYTVDGSGSIVLQDILKHNTAYYLKETQAPEGYAIRDKLYYFGIRHGDTEMYPEGYPYGFNSWVEKDSNDQYSGTFYNAKLYVTKEWYDENHVLLEDALADELNPIEFELRLKTEYTPVETGKKTVRFDVNTWGASYSHSSKQLEPGTDVTIVLKQSTTESWAIVDPSLNINGTELAYEQEKSEANGVYSQKITIKLENVQDNIVISGDLKWDLSTWSAPEFTYEAPEAVTPPADKDELVATDSISANDDWIIGYNDVKVSGEETIDGVRYNVKYTYYVVEKEASIHTGFRYWECDNNNLDLANAQKQTITLKNDCKDPVFSDVTVKKVEKGSESTLLSGAQFILTRYDNGSWLQIMQGTTQNGVLTLPRLSMDTLYRLEETKAPAGYEVETQYTYFWIKSTDTATVAMPEGISATAFGPGAGNYQLTIANPKTYVPEYVNISVTKVWDDSDDKAGFRPASVIVKLLADGADSGKSLTLNAANSWTGRFENLDKHKNNGKDEIRYTIEEVSVPGYTTSIAGSAASGYTITNSYTPEKTQFSVIKDWDDANNQDGKRPAAITVNLLANGKVVSTAELVADNGWTHTFADLDVYENGQKIIYTVQESVVPDGYTAKVDGHTITNTHVPEKLSIPVEKIWNDANNQDGKRPASVTVKLLANGADAGKTLVLNEGNAWKGTFTDLPKFAAGVPIAYTVEEISVERYTTEITGDVSGFTITNTYTPELTQLRVNKIWKDADDQDGKRPYAVVITLRVNGQATNKTVTLNSSNNWTGQWSDLPKYSQGMLVEYNAVETGYYQTKADFDNNTNLIGKVPEGYTVTHGEVTYADGIYSVSVTNTYDPETVGLNVQKAWEDDDDRDGIRPDTITVTLQKKVNGGSWITVLDESGKPVTRTLTADTKWEADFVKLPKYEDGNEITYSVAEIAVPGYEVTYSLDNKLKVVTVTNTHTPEQTEVPVIKVWEDADNQDGKRPASITVNLLANGSKVDTVTLNEANQWKHTFKDLPLNAGGNAINYTVEEVKVDGYTSVVTGNAVNGYTLTNTHTPETVNIPVVKTWEDAQDQDGKRPDTITVNLLADGNVVGSAELTKAADWKHTFRDLPKYAAGKEIAYTVQEPEIPDGYTSEVAGYTIINTHEPETVDVPVVKVWVDEDNKNGVRPYAVVITLHINGMPSDQSLTLNDSNQWQGKWEDLPMYSHGQKITYSVVETGYYMTETEYESGALISKVPEDYTVTHSYNADKAGVYTATVTNTYDPQHTGLNVQKEWNDADNQDGIRPETVIVTLMQKIGSGEWTVVKDAEGNPVTRTLTEENKWEADFIGLPRYADELEITYSVVEAEVPGYEADYSLDESVKVVTVTNTHIPELIQIPVTKVWEDDNNQDGKRPDSITVNLLGDGKKVASAQLNEDNKWTHTFTNLPKNAGGKAIVYTVEEIAVANYMDEISGDAVEGFTIRNRLLELSVVKQWFDAAGNQVSELSGMQAVTFKLYQKARFTPVDGAPAKTDETTVLYTGTLSQENNWRYDQTNGLKTRERLTIGEYTYDVSYSYFAEETGIPAGYELIGIVNNNVDLFSTDDTVITIRNQPVPKQTTSLTITKVAKEDTDSKLPGAQFTLYKWDAKWVKVGVLTSDSDGKIEFTGLEFNTAYKLEESKAPVGYQKDGGPWYFFYEKADTATYPVSRPENDTDYTKNVSDKTAIQITNPEIPEDTSLELTVKKTWYAKNATKAGTAPSSISKITFKLYRKAVTTDGKTVKLKDNLVDTYTITKKDGWKLTITGLSAKGYEMVNGVKTEVKYTYYVEENKVDGYKVSYKGQNTANIEIRNTENPTDTTNPKTGDSSHIGLYLLTMLLSGTALVFTATRKRRRW